MTNISSVLRMRRMRLTEVLLVSVEQVVVRHQRSRK